MLNTCGAFCQRMWRWTLVVDICGQFQWRRRVSINGFYSWRLNGTSMLKADSSFAFAGVGGLATVGELLPSYFALVAIWEHLVGHCVGSLHQFRRYKSWSGFLNKAKSWLACHFPDGGHPLIFVYPRWLTCLHSWSNYQCGICGYVLQARGIKRASERWWGILGAVNTLERWITSILDSIL